MNSRRSQASHATKDFATVSMVTLLAQDNALHATSCLQFDTVFYCAFLSAVLNSKYLKFLHSTAAFQGPFKTFWTQCKDQF